MGQSTDAVLMYGYDLGSAERFKVQEWDDREYRLAVDWYPTDDEQDVDVVDLLERRMRDAGVEGINVSSYCSCEFPMFVVSARTITVSRGDVEVLDLAELGSRRLEMNADLARALAVIGLTPLQEQPEWLLASMWC